MMKNAYLYHTNNSARASDKPISIPSGKRIQAFEYYSPILKRKTSFDEYVQTQCVTGLLIIKNSQIVFEEYYRGRNARDHFGSASVSKSILALLIGLAIADGKLTLQTRVVDVLNDFDKSAFGQSTIEDLLRMVSGVELVTSYDYGRMAGDNQATDPIQSPRTDIEEYLRNKRALAAPPGQMFNYNGAISGLLGVILTKATGQSATKYLEQRVWQSIGTEKNAYWIKNYRGQEGVQGHFDATLRDYGRLALLLLNRGKVGSSQVVPESWVEQMTALRKDKPQPKTPPFYGFHIWIPQAAMGRAQMMGLHGQHIYTDPVENVVIVHMAVDMHPEGPLEFFPFRNAIVSQLRNYQ
jgi:CubicO group peptidase (beta-lactamase class C family)